MKIYSSLRAFRRDLLSEISRETPKVVSFDVFDTLVVRRCAPDAVLHGVGRWLDERIRELNLSPRSSALQAYHQAYADLVRQNVERSLDDEVFTQDIYRHWVQCLVGEGASQELATELEAKMLEFEKGACMRHHPFVEILSTLRELEVPCIFVSDMYIGGKAVWEILRSVGLDTYFTSGFVSGDFAKLKRTGKLFDDVLGAMGLQGREVIHIGDNPVSDGLSAQQKGLRSFVVQEKGHFRRRKTLESDFSFIQRERSFGGAFIGRFAQANAGELGTPQQAYGHRVLGPIYSAFTHKVLERCRQENIEAVYFVAREGYLLTDLAHQLSKVVYGEKGIPIHYLFVSRLVTLLAASKKIGLREVAVGLANGPATIANILSFLRLSSAELETLCARYGLPSPHAQLPEFFLSWPPFMRLLDDEELQQKVAAIQRESRDLLIRYLEQENFFDNRRVALVDVGWAGQIQESLYSAIKDDPRCPQLFGMYMGLRLHGHWRKEPRNWMEWIICDDCHFDWSGQSAFQFPQGFESIPRAPHGTVLGYRENETGFVEPILKSDHDPSRLRESSHDHVFSAFQVGIAEYCRHYATAASMMGITATEAMGYARDLTERMIRYPTKAEASWFLGMANVSDLGSDMTYQMGGLGASSKKAWRRRGRLEVTGGSFWNYGSLAAHGGFLAQAAWALEHDVKGIPPLEAGVGPGIPFHAPLDDPSVESRDRSRRRVIPTSRWGNSPFLRTLTQNMEKASKNYRRHIEEMQGAVALNRHTPPLTALELGRAYVVYKLAQRACMKGNRKPIYRGGIPMSLYLERAALDRPWFDRILRILYRMGK